MLAKILAFVFAIIEVLLGLRLLLPFVHWPSALDEWIPRLISVTDVLAAPFQPLIKTLDLRSGLSASGGGLLGGYVNNVDPGVLLAMAGWGVITVVVLLLVSLLSRAR